MAEIPNDGKTFMHRELEAVTTAAGIPQQAVFTILRGIPAIVRRALAWRLWYFHGVRVVHLATFLGLRQSTCSDLLKEAQALFRRDPYFAQFCTRLEWSGPPVVEE